MHLNVRKTVDREANSLGPDIQDTGLLEVPPECNTCPSAVFRFTRGSSGANVVRSLP